MLCEKPFIKAGAAYRCGHCKPCRYNRRRTWMHRIMLEGFLHADKAFVTLTYSDDSLVFDWRTRRAILVQKHMQDWLKRFRLQIEPVRVRFYGVGEYGDRTERPHFHVILFGFPTCIRGRTKREFNSTRPNWRECCPVCRLVGDSWGKGDVDLGTVTRDSASYCANYTVKKMTSEDDSRLKGRPPEFCRMSLRPGIGADAMWDVASDLMASQFDRFMVDVPTSIGYGNLQLPIGRYLRRKLRRYVGRDEKVPEEVLQSMAEELRPLREAAFNSSRSFAQALVSESDGKRINFEARSKLFSERKTL